MVGDDRGMVGGREGVRIRTEQKKRMSFWDILWYEIQDRRLANHNDTLRGGADLHHVDSGSRHLDSAFRILNFDFGDAATDGIVDADGHVLHTLHNNLVADTVEDRKSTRLNSSHL